MFILLINCPFDDVISESQRKGTAVLGDGEIFAGLLPEVVATGAGICDKALMRRQNRVAKKRSGKISRTLCLSMGIRWL